MRKRGVTVLAAAALSLIMASTAFAGTWEDQGGRWKYHNDDGSYAAAQWIQDQGAWYYVEQDGFMKTGWYQDGSGVWYYFDDTTGAMMSNTTSNIGGVDYTFDSSGAWVQQAAALNEGWNGTTYVNRRLGYQITIPDYYQAVTSEDNLTMPEESRYDFVAESPDGSSALLVAEVNMSQLDGYEWSDEDIAVLMKDYFGSSSEVIGATFNDLGFAKLNVTEENGMVLDVYFRRCGSSIMMVEVAYEKGKWQDIENILQTMRIPQ